MLPVTCPSCRAQLRVRKMQCEQCGTEVSGNYELPELALLSPDEQLFVLQFVKSSGSLKEMSVLRRLSYPTVRNMLNEIILKLNAYETK